MYTCLFEKARYDSGVDIPLQLHRRRSSSRSSTVEAKAGLRSTVVLVGCSAAPSLDSVSIGGSGGGGEVDGAVLVAKGRAQVGVAASSGDWSKRIRDMQYTDHEDYTMGS